MEVPYLVLFAKVGEEPAVTIERWLSELSEAIISWQKK